MAVIKKYTAEVVSVKSEIADVYTVEFCSKGKPFKYAPGQFLHLALDQYDPSMQWPESRCFSMQSAPDEEFIRITYAVKGSFTHRMKEELSDGKIVTLKLPYGDLFTQPHRKEKVVFIAGGTGITPFLSLFNHFSFKEYVNPSIYMGFRRKAFDIYATELKHVEQFIQSVSYEDYNGMLDIKSIFQANGVDSTYFLSGPPQMIKHFRQYLIINNVMENHVLTDEWE
ncbi:MAG: FAD-dependent oxidoreductase [Bacteroidales bacterium]|nr:FAD-dependent oxidoreductase [Bacteroidales bacterium]